VVACYMSRHLSLPSPMSGMPSMPLSSSSSSGICGPPSAPRLNPVQTTYVVSRASVSVQTAAVRVRWCCAVVRVRVRQRQRRSKLTWGHLLHDVLRWLAVLLHLRHTERNVGLGYWIRSHDVIEKR
jgi:hypothetical protein